MKKVGIVLSLCIHLAYSVVSGLMLFGYWGSLEDGSFAGTIPEGSGMIGLVVLAVMGVLLVGLLLICLASLAAVLFEVCDLILDKRGFAFAYGMISLGFLLFLGGTGVDMAIELFASGGLAALLSAEMAAFGALALSALVPTVVAASRVFND